jgi:hypothetical protein
VPIEVFFALKGLVLVMQTLQKARLETSLVSFLTEHHTMKAYWGVEI